MNLPVQFIKSIQHSFGEHGEQWLEDLPALIEIASAQWGLKNITPVSNLSYNFVAFALVDGRVGGRGFDRLGSTLLLPPYRDQVVLKIGVPNLELKSEIAALKFFNGQGAVRLLDADEARSMFLLERLSPGRMLSEIEDDESATRIAAEVMKNLWKPAPQEHEFILLKNWFAEINLRKQYEGGTGPLPKRYVEIAEGYIADLFGDESSQVVLHGDCHHFNILQAGDEWKVIDPKGVVGDSGYEVAPFLINPNDRFLKFNNPTQITEKRISIFSEHLGIERQRLKMWGVAHCLLSAWWDLDDEGDGWQYAMRCAEIIEKVKLV